LNIIVHAKRKHEVPVLLNYLTAPDVVIWSAASASCAVPGIYDSATLLSKDSKGQLVSWNPSAVRLSSARILDEIPVSRLSELFNVNNFIVSHVPSYFSLKRHKSKGSSPLALLNNILSWLFNEFQHRITQLKVLGLIPVPLQRLEQVITAPTVGDIQISPTILKSDLKYLFTNPTPEFLRYCMFKGESACWKNISQIEIRCAIESELDQMINNLKVHRSSTKKLQQKDL
jgi:predicted acylesterase/phospholipase RssA